MKIEALIVCVGFDDLLAITLPSVIAEVDRVMVVTSLSDVATAKCASRLGAWTLATDTFYIHGAAFNKAAALNEAIASGLLDLDEWLMVLDADVVLPAGMGQVVEDEATDKATLYGASRLMCPDAATWRDGGPFSPIPDPCELPGFLHCVWAPDVSVPWYDASYEHAGGYDSLFQKRWPKGRKARFSQPVVHLGPLGQNWHGRRTERWSGEGVGQPDIEKIEAARARYEGLKADGVPGRDRRRSKLV